MLLPAQTLEALEIVRLRKRTMTKNTLSGNKAAQPVTYLDIPGSTIAALNLGTVVGDLTASVQTLQTYGYQQIGDTIETLTTAIGESKEIKDGDRKDLLENLALVE